MMTPVFEMFDPCVKTTLFTMSNIAVDTCANMSLLLRIRIRITLFYIKFLKLQSLVVSYLSMGNKLVDPCINTLWLLWVI